MRRDDEPTPKGQTARADLLRALASGAPSCLTLDADATGWFGYEYRPPKHIDETGQFASSDRSRTGSGTAASGTPARMPLRMPFVHRVVERTEREPRAADPEQRARLTDLQPLDVDPEAPPSPVRLVDYEDLVPAARLMPALQRGLSMARPGGLDVARLARHLADHDLPRHLPRRRIRRWHPDLVVLLDFSLRLRPFREDMHRLAERLLRRCGRNGISLRILKRGPFGPWTDWVVEQSTAGDPFRPPRKRPVAGSRVLIASDFGRFLPPDAPERNAWVRYVAMLTDAGVEPIALAPLGAALVDGQLSRALPVLRWSPDAPMRPARADGAGRPVPEGLDDLLALIAAIRRVDPPLLRALRALVPKHGLDAGLEGAVWSHGDVDAKESAEMKTDRAAPHLQRFERIRPELRDQADRLRRRHHAHLRAALNHEETMLWAAHAQDDVAADPAARERLDAARTFLARLLATLGARRDAGTWHDFARDFLKRSDAAMAAHSPQALVGLLVAMKRHGLAPEATPGWADPQVIRSVTDEPELPREFSLVLDVRRGRVVLQATAPGPRQISLENGIAVDSGGVRITCQGAGSESTRWYPVSTQSVMVMPMVAEASASIETSSSARTVAPLDRPPGAEAWSWGPDGIRVTSPPLAGERVEWSGDRLSAAFTARPDDPELRWRLYSAILLHSELMPNLSVGLDTDFGLYANLVITGRHGSATQRFRWIEPGTFMMGSPSDEAEREDREGPKHPVTLTEGFWLADTACTQALWEAVMGSNPSHFKGDPQCPVEQVSWEDVQEFLMMLENLVPGCGACLPTEAQWEYACRAGTTTAFSFGDRITSEQVNYDGNYPYAGGEKGEYREKTVAVKRLPPNPWGLYEMHGNVYEWCADGLRDFTEDAVTDPEGPAVSEEARAVRGGSWCDDAWWARSACRFAFHPGGAFRFLGFRLCLRSSEPGPSRPGGTADVPPGGRPAVERPPRDEAGLLEKVLRPFRRPRPPKPFKV